MNQREPRPGRHPVIRPVRWIGLVARALFGTPARALRGTARRVGDPARQVIEYFASERVTIKQGFIANIISALTSLVAGLALAGMGKRILEVEGLFVLIPVSIGMRGNIFGALAARLGTQIHSGLFEVTREKGSLFYQNVQSAVLLTFATSVTMGVLARGIAALLGVGTVSLWDFIIIALVGGLLSSAIVLVVTVILSIQSYRRGWDLDSVGAPLITAIGDVVTLPCLLLASYLIGNRLITVGGGGLLLVLGILSVAWGVTSKRALLQRIVRESFPILCVAIVLDVLAGTVVQPSMATVFTPFPALLILIPGFLENTGALGGILASRLGSKLHLGAVTPSVKPEPAALLDAMIVLLMGLTVYLITAFSTLALAEVIGARHPGAATFIGVTLVGGLLATVLASLIGYYAAITTYRFGFDPDNHTIPLVTSGMDLMGIICLVLALNVFGVA